MTSGARAPGRKVHKRGTVMAAVQLDQSAIDALRSDVRGGVLLSGDGEYDDARALYNARASSYSPSADSKTPPRTSLRSASIADWSSCTAAMTVPLLWTFLPGARAPDVI